MAENYRVTYYDMSIPCDTSCVVTLVVWAASEEEATYKADACLDQDRFTWVNTESEDHYQWEMSVLESGEFYGPDGDLYPD